MSSLGWSLALPCLLLCISKSPPIHSECFWSVFITYSFVAMDLILPTTDQPTTTKDDIHGVDLCWWWREGRNCHCVFANLILRYYQIGLSTSIHFGYGSFDGNNVLMMIMPLLLLLPIHPALLKALSTPLLGHPQPPPPSQSNVSLGNQLTTRRILVNSLSLGRIFHSSGIFIGSSARTTRCVVE